MVSNRVVISVLLFLRNIFGGCLCRVSMVVL